MFGVMRWGQDDCPSREPNRRWEFGIELGQKLSKCQLDLFRVPFRDCPQNLCPRARADERVEKVPAKCIYIAGTRVAFCNSVIEIAKRRHVLSGTELKMRCCSLRQIVSWRKREKATSGVIGFAELALDVASSAELERGNVHLPRSIKL